MYVSVRNNWKSAISPMLPLKIQKLLEPIDVDLPLEEIRIRAGKPLQLLFGTYERLIYPYKDSITESDCTELLESICAHSIYAWEEELKNGFITMPGGYRVGLAGKAYIVDGKIKRVSVTTSFNIRISRECIGFADSVVPKIINEKGFPYSTLVVSPPGCGKTTLLRDLIRQFSIGLNGAAPCKVSVVDERSELTGCYQGVPQLDVGPRADILDGCPKAIGINYLLRTMSPQIIVTDEIGNEEDSGAVLNACTCGVSVFASAHGRSYLDVVSRPALRQLYKHNCFERIVVLDRYRGKPHISSILNTSQKECSISANNS